MEFFVDGTEFVSSGPMQRISGGWRYGNFTPLPIGLFYFRVKGTTSFGLYGGSGSSIQKSVLGSTDFNEGIFNNGFQ